MNGFFTEKGLLSVSIGEGYLSSFEAGTLQTGDVVKTGRLAGCPSTLLFNGLPLAACEVVILSDALAVRVTDSDIPQPIPLEPSRRDDVVELLPISVILGSIRVSLAELAGVGRYTFINLGKPFSEKEDAELLVAGMPRAAGKVVCIEENMGIRVTRTLGEASQVSNVRSSGNLLDATSRRRVKDYDFRRPDKFSRAAIMNVQDLHSMFLRNLAVVLPEAARLLSPDATAPVVDQCTYQEALEELARRGEYRACIIESSAGRGPSRASADRPRFAPAGKALLEDEGTAHPVSQQTRAFIEKIGQDWGYTYRDLVFVYWRVGGPLASVLERPQTRQALLSCLRGGWKNIVNLGFREAVQEEGHSVRIPDREMVITVTFPGAGGGGTELAILYPYLTLEPLMRILG
jgi:flagellar motor switch/type III secretory pathway protein FliN